MPTEERVRVNLSNVRNYYSHGSTVIFRNLIRFPIGSSLKNILH
ncbi:hypothetical protein Godav_003911 [Gossypium davidsonii]|uniref:Uncharacterized protein n=2 Tax=Gossypium TaxID=3633 RepID=A0A7J8SKZ9_GOSDV|nr:hypothetical protein [Gossypium davidsonii]MBA0661801.1 hypothetical protein [Gossypium klotzschianum]